MKRDNGRLLMLIAFLAAIPAVYGQWGAVRQKGVVTNGNMVVWYKNNEVSDSGINPGALTNAAAVAEVLGTNTASTIEFNTNKNQPNGYAGLNENGMISTNAIPYFIAVYTGDDYVQ